MLLAIILYMKFDPTLSIIESPFTVQLDWIPSFNIQYYIGVDGLSMPMIILAALLSFLCILDGQWSAQTRVGIIVGIVLHMSFTIYNDDGGA